MVSSFIDVEVSSESSGRSSGAQWQHVDIVNASESDAAQDVKQRTREELEQETQAAKQAVAALDEAVAAATSFREPATELVGEAHRALNRLEQARLSKVSPELIVVACEIKCQAKKGLTLVNVHGGYTTLGKLVTLVARQTINQKFDKISLSLRSQLPVAGDPQRTGSSITQSNTTYTGTELRQATHEKIHAITYVPDHHAPGRVCIWWSAGRQLEFYTDASQSATTCFSNDKSALTVTSIAIDAYGQIWTGHLKGMVRVRKKQQWDYAIEQKFFNHAVRCIAFDATGCAWMGDDGGYIKVVRCDDMQTDSLEQVAAVYANAQIQHCHSINLDSGSVLSMMTRTFWPSAIPSEPDPCEGPIHCILIRDNNVWVGGGRCEPWLGCWDALTYTEKDMYLELKAYGVPHSMTQIPWGVGDETLQWSNHHTSWRLLTGHENGQVLMWSPTSKLQPLLAIEGSSSIKGLTFLENCNLILTGHGNGQLALFAPPAADVAITGAETGGVVPVVKPRRATIPAHRSPVAFIACQGASVVSASTNGTVKLWQVTQLLKEAERQGLTVHSGATAMDIHLAAGRDHLVPISEGSGARSSGVEASPGSAVLSHSDKSTFPPENVISPTELTMQKIIGNGAYGRVWLAEWGGTRVAVKEVGHPNGAESGSLPFTYPGSGAGNRKDELEVLNNEVHMLASLSHPNIVRFCAQCLDPPLIVMQHYPHGSLYDLLKKARKQQKPMNELTWAKRLDMLRDVAAGMQFLHKRNVVHGDLRSPNLLLDYMLERGQPRFHIRIADFGLARALSPNIDNVAVSKHTNPRWAAPELIKQSQLSRPADVYSFAVVMWELLTWQQPFEDMKSVQVIFSATELNKRPELPPNDQLPGSPGTTLPEYLQLMQICWADDAEQRPSFGQILAAVDHMREQEYIPPARRKFTRNESIERVKALTVPQAELPLVEDGRQRRTSLDILMEDTATPSPQPGTPNYAASTEVPSRMPTYPAPTIGPPHDALGYAVADTEVPSRTPSFSTLTNDLPQRIPSYTPSTNDPRISTPNPTSPVTSPPTRTPSYASGSHTAGTTSPPARSASLTTGTADPATHTHGYTFTATGTSFPTHSGINSLRTDTERTDSHTAWGYPSAGVSPTRFASMPANTLPPAGILDIGVVGTATPPLQSPFAPQRPASATNVPSNSTALKPSTAASPFAPQRPASVTNLPSSAAAFKANTAASPFASQRPASATEVPTSSAPVFKSNTVESPFAPHRPASTTNLPSTTASFKPNTVESPFAPKRPASTTTASTTDSVFKPTTSPSPLPPQRPSSASVSTTDSVFKQNTATSAVAPLRPSSASVSTTDSVFKQNTATSAFGSSRPVATSLPEPLTHKPPPQKEVSPFLQQNTLGITSLPQGVTSPTSPAAGVMKLQSPYMWGGNLGAGTGIGRGSTSTAGKDGRPAAAQYTVPSSPPPLHNNIHKAATPASPPGDSPTEIWDPFNNHHPTSPDSSRPPSSSSASGAFTPSRTGLANHHHLSTPNIIPAPHHTTSLPSSSSSSLENASRSSVTHWPTSSTNPFANTRPLVIPSSLSLDHVGDTLPHTISLPNMELAAGKGPSTNDVPLIRLDSDPPLSLEDAARILQEGRKGEVPPTHASESKPAQTPPRPRPARQQLMSPFAMPSLQDPTA